jgi:hypothetical protein
MHLQPVPSAKWECEMTAELRCNACALRMVDPSHETTTECTAELREFVKRFNAVLPPHVIEIAALRAEVDRLTAERAEAVRLVARTLSRERRFKGWRVRYEFNDWQRNEWKPAAFPKRECSLGEARDWVRSCRVYGYRNPKIFRVYRKDRGAK